MELQKTKETAEELIAKHCPEFRFVFDNAKVRFGCCNFRKKEISLSRELALLNDEKNVLDTILHEIAHAVVGKGHGHDRVWRAKAIELGCDGNRCYTHDDVKVPTGKYTYECTSCGRQIQRFRRIKRTIACGGCCKTFNNNRFSEKYAFKRKYEVQK